MMAELKVASAAFVMNAAVPAPNLYDGPNRSPPLSWSDVPDGTKSLAVICDDPDAPRGTWVHWVLFNLPPGTTQLPEGIPKDRKLPSGAIQGVNDFRQPGYDGPAPPPGKPHRYVFKVYALDAMLPLGPGAIKADVEKAMKGRILAQGQLVGMYKR